jgi:hypothetical protein
VLSTFHFCLQTAQIPGFNPYATGCIYGAKPLLEHALLCQKKTEKNGLLILRMYLRVAGNRGISAAAQIFAFSLTYNCNLPMILWYWKQVLIKTLKTQE